MTYDDWTLQTNISQKMWDSPLFSTPHTCECMFVLKNLNVRLYGRLSMENSLKNYMF